MGRLGGWLGRGLMALAMAGGLASCGGGGRGSDAQLLAGVMKADLAASTDSAWTGSYWNPAEPGTGLFFEKQGAKGTLALYLFETTGRSVWYSASGDLKATDAGFDFSGTLVRFVGGQHAKSSAPRQPAAMEVGPVSVSFSGDGKARVKVPGREFDAERLARSAGAFPSVPTADRSLDPPEAGIYWNSAESGRGYTIETINGYITVGIYHYDEDGRPIWHLVTAPLARDGSSSGDFASYRDGQALAGAYRAPVRESGSDLFVLDRMSACGGRIQFPGMGKVVIERFPFNPPAAACRTVAADPSFGGPSGGSGAAQTGDGSALAAAGISFPRYPLQGTSLFKRLSIDAVAAGLNGRPARYSVMLGALPQGMQLDPASGRLSGVPTQVGSFKGQIGLAVDGIPGMLLSDFEIVVTPLTIVFDGPISLRAGEPVTAGSRFIIADASGQRVELEPNVSTVITTRNLPYGLMIDPFSGVVSGSVARVGGGSYAAFVDVDASVSYNRIPVMLKAKLRFDILQ